MVVSGGLGCGILQVFKSIPYIHLRIGIINILGCYCMILVLFYRIFVFFMIQTVLGSNNGLMVTGVRRVSVASKYLPLGECIESLRSQA